MVWFLLTRRENMCSFKTTKQQRNISAVELFGISLWAKNVNANVEKNQHHDDPLNNAIPFENILQ